MIKVQKVEVARTLIRMASHGTFVEEVPAITIGGKPKNRFFKDSNLNVSYVEVYENGVITKVNVINHYTDKIITIEIDDNEMRRDFSGLVKKIREVTGDAAAEVEIENARIAAENQEVETTVANISTVLTPENGWEFSGSDKTCYWQTVEARFREVVKEQNRLIDRVACYEKFLEEAKAEFGSLVIEPGNATFERSCKALARIIELYENCMQTYLKNYNLGERDLAELKAKYPEHAEEFIAKYSEHVA